MKSGCCEKRMQWLGTVAVGDRTHYVWFCRRCHKFYSQRTRVGKTPRIPAGLTYGQLYRVGDTVVVEYEGRRITLS